MSASLREKFSPDDPSARITGMVLITCGLAVFLVIFLAVFPVLKDPAGTYDEWFPPGEEEPEAETAPTAPRAGFEWLAEGNQEQGEAPEGEAPEGEAPEGEETPSVFKAHFQDRSERGDASIVIWVWDLGDGSTARGRSVEHEYASPGDYQVSVEIEDENGQGDVADTRIFVPEQGREEGQVEPRGESLDLSGIEASVDKIADSLVDAVRASIVIGLFSLAAVVMSLLGWRLTRGGVLLLRPVTSGSSKRPATRRRRRAEVESSSPNGAPEEENRRESARLLVE